MKRRSFLGLLAFMLPVAKAACATAEPVVLAKMSAEDILQQVAIDFAQAAHVPDPIRVLNLDKAMRHYGDLNNFPSDCVFTEQEVTDAKARVRRQFMTDVDGAKVFPRNVWLKFYSGDRIPGGPGRWWVET